MVNRHCVRVCIWSTGIVPEFACYQQALCQSVHAVNRHCARVCMRSTGIVAECMRSTGIVSECACGQQALFQSVHVVNRHCVRVCMWSTGCPSGRWDVNCAMTCSPTCKAGCLPDTGQCKCTPDSCPHGYFCQPNVSSTSPHPFADPNYLNPPPPPPLTQIMYPHPQ